MSNGGVTVKRILFIILALCVLFISCDDTPSIENESSSELSSEQESMGYEYILNTSTLKYHAQFCSVIPTIKEENRSTTTNIEFYIERGYVPCEKCILR